MHFCLNIRKEYNTKIKYFSVFTDTNSEDIGYGDFSALQNDSIDKMAQLHHQLFHDDTSNDLHDCGRFKQLESPSNDSQLQGKTPKDEQHQLENYEKENAILIAETSISLEYQKHLHQNERSKYNESQKTKQCIPDTHLTTKLSNEYTNGTGVSPVESSAHPQSYLNMDGNVSMTESEQSDNQEKQDMLFFLGDKTSHSSDNTSKVTNV